MTRRLISSGSRFEELAGFSRAVVDGGWVFVSGTTGFDYASGSISDDVEERAEQAFRNIKDALEEAGTSLADVLRARVYLADAADFDRTPPTSTAWPRSLGAISATSARPTPRSSARSSIGA